MVSRDQLREILQDDVKFCANFLKIPAKPDIQGAVHLVPMILNRVQQYLAIHRGLRNIIVKPRQVGVSTAILAFNFRRILTTPYLRGLLIAHKDEVTMMLLDRLNIFYDNLPPPLQLPTDRQSQRELRFATLNSGIHIETASARVTGRSETLGFAHLSEPAHWAPERVDELMAGIDEAVPKTGVEDKESTPKGNSGYFYELYQASKREETPYKTFFFPWWWDKDYRLERGNPLALPSDKGILTFTPEETYLINNFALDEDQIRWRRFKSSKNELGELFFQEYPENDVDCWLSTGTLIFDAVALRQQRLHYIQKPMREEDGILYWRLPVGGQSYIIGVDPALGLPNGDFSVASVFESRSCEQVAIYRARIGADLFGEKVKYLGKRYNNAMIVVETTGGYGETMLRMLTDYPNLYQDVGNTKPGWSTNTKTRPFMISTYATALRSDGIMIHDEVTLQESQDFQDLGEGRLSVPRGSHDDSLFAAMLALTARQIQPQHITRPRPVRYH